MDDGVASGAGGGLGSSVAMPITVVKPVSVDTPSGPVTVLVICEVREVVLLEAVEGAAVVDLSELGAEDRDVGAVDEGLVVRVVEGAVVGRAAEVEAVLRLLVVVVFDCRFANLTCLNLGPL